VGRKSTALRSRTLVPPTGVAPLTGYTVAVASDRRRHPLAELLEAVGAKVTSFQAVRAFSDGAAPGVRDITEQVVAGRIDELLVASAFGFRAWLRATRQWGLTDRLVAGFRPARLLASNPSAADALREIGLTEIWSTATATTDDLVRYLLAQRLSGRRIVIQSDGVGVAELGHALRGAGAEVLEVRTYRYQPPAYSDLLRRLVGQVVNHQVDAVAFTAAPAVRHLLARAADDGRGEPLVRALGVVVPAFCLGRGGAAVLSAAGVAGATPDSPFLEELVALVGAVVPRQAVKLETAGYRLEVRGQAVVLNDELIPVPPGPIAVLRALARNPGRVLACADIRNSASGWADVDDHAIEMAVSRLRQILHDGDLIQTVMQRGYSLAE